MKRTGNYKNVFDPHSGFMHPKEADGTFRKTKFDPFTTIGMGFIEGNAWNYTLYVPQDPAALANLAAAVARHDVYGLGALGVLVPALGSLVLGLAVSEGAITPADAHALTALDETFQEELWGRDPESHAGRLRVAADVATAARFLALARAA